LFGSVETVHTAMSGFGVVSVCCLMKVVILSVMIVAVCWLRLSCDVQVICGWSRMKDRGSELSEFGVFVTLPPSLRCSSAKMVCLLFASVVQIAHEVSRFAGNCVVFVRDKCLEVVGSEDYSSRCIWESGIKFSYGVR
jgi:hypothetical protein